MAAGDDLRRAVLDASLELIEAEGVGALSLREVARRAGVSHQAPYHHFRDREAILAALAAEGYARLHAEMRRTAASARTPVTRLDAVGRAYITFALDNPALFKVMHQSELVPLDAHKDAMESAQDAFGMMVEIVEEVAKDRNLAADALAMTAWSLVHGAATLLLENKLQQKFPRAQGKPRVAIDAVLTTFRRLYD